jgi:hypothetical protein
VNLVLASERGETLGVFAMVSTVKRGCFWSLFVECENDISKMDSYAAGAKTAERRGICPGTLTYSRASNYCRVPSFWEEMVPITHSYPGLMPPYLVECPPFLAVFDPRAESHNSYLINAV